MTTLKVFYVDDDDDIREVAAMSLEMDPTMEVRTARGGRDALDQLAADTWRPDVLLLDVMMPGMDGPSLLGHIRARGDMRDTPAIFITARAHPDEQRRFLSAGGIGVIPKPFDPVGLASEVRAVMAADRS